MSEIVETPPATGPTDRITPWVGVDLDGTLAVYDGWKGEEQIGPPIQSMVDRIKAWLSEGKRVKIFTARAYGRPQIALVIQRWLMEEAGLPALEVTCVKDFGMIELWDDRCIQVEFNTGMPVLA